MLGLALLCRATDFSCAVEALYEQRYDDAWRLIGQFSPDTPDPRGAYWQASLVQMLCYETGSRAMVDSFYRMSGRVEALCRERISRNKDDTSAYLYLGMMRLNRANGLAWEQKHVQAMRVMGSAVAPLGAALAADATLTDAAYGLGMIEFFRSLGDRYLLGLGILGSRSKAFRLVERGAQGKGLSAVSARFSLAWMKGQEKKHEEALSECRRLLARYPGNRMLLRMMRDINLNKGDCSEVMRLGQEMDQSIAASFPQNRYYLAENRLVMAKACLKSGRNDEARALLNQVIAWEGQQDRVPWLRHYVAEAKTLKRGMGR